MFSTLRARGVLRTAATWAVGLSVLASTLLIGGVELGVVPASVFGIRELVALAARNFVAGGIMGALFALAVSHWERGRDIGELRYSRFSGAGFVSGTALGIALGLAAPGLLPTSVLLAGTAGLGVLAAGFSMATLAFVRRAAGLPISPRLKNAMQPSLPPMT